MLLAGMVLCGFVPLIRSGQELAERAFLERLLRARAASVALRYGTPRYNALPCSSARVFSVLHDHAGEQLIGLLNVSAHKQTVAISVPVDQLCLAEGEYELYDLFGCTRWVEDATYHGRAINCWRCRSRWSHSLPTAWQCGLRRLRLARLTPM